LIEERDRELLSAGETARDGVRGGMAPVQRAPVSDEDERPRRLGGFGCEQDAGDGVTINVEREATVDHAVFGDGFLSPAHLTDPIPRLRGEGTLTMSK